MRTTITIDDDLFKAARSFATARNISIGKVISEWARKGLQRQDSYTARTGLPVFAVREDARPISLDDVKSHEDDES